MATVSEPEIVPNTLMMIILDQPSDARPVSLFQGEDIAMVWRLSAEQSVHSLCSGTRVILAKVLVNRVLATKFASMIMMKLNQFSDARLVQELLESKDTQRP